MFLSDQLGEHWAFQAAISLASASVRTIAQPPRRTVIRRRTFLVRHRRFVCAPVGHILISFKSEFPLRIAEALEGLAFPGSTTFQSAFNAPRQPFQERIFQNQGFILAKGEHQKWKR